MESDSSASDGPTSRKKVSKRALYSSDDHESDRPIKKRKGTGRKMSGPSEGRDSFNRKNEECAICSDNLLPGQELARPSVCEHRFHPQCIKKWSKTSNTCPLDRKKYKEILVKTSCGEETIYQVTTPPPQNHNDDLLQVTDDTADLSPSSVISGDDDSYLTDEMTFQEYRSTQPDSVCEFCGTPANDSGDCCYAAFIDGLDYQYNSNVSNSDSSNFSFDSTNTNSTSDRDTSSDSLQ